MKIAHICLASAYTDGLTYQDNLLPAQNRKDGHDVLIVSECLHYVDGRLHYAEPEDRILGDGCRLVRLPFAGKLLPGIVRNRLRITPGLGPLLEAFGPDVILYHGVGGLEMLTCSAYKKRNPKTRLYVDCHQDYTNSGRYYLSRLLQYRLLTRFLWREIQSSVDKVLYVSDEARDFLVREIDVDPGHLEFFPLGGNILNESTRREVRSRLRSELGLHDEVVFIHAGKLNSAKKTVEVLEAFVRQSTSSYRLIVAGSLEIDIRDRAEKLISSDSRIAFLGWQSGMRLIELLCASDCYVQPGTQSATLQVALCCGLPILVAPWPSHNRYLRSNGYFVASVDEIAHRMAGISNTEMRQRMSLNSLDIAENLLDYRRLAAKMYR